MELRTVFRRPLCSPPRSIFRDPRRRQMSRERPRDVSPGVPKAGADAGAPCHEGAAVAPEPKPIKRAVTLDMDDTPGTAAGSGAASAGGAETTAMLVLGPALHTDSVSNRPAAKILGPN